MDGLNAHSQSLLRYVIEWTPPPQLSRCRGKTREEKLRMRTLKRTLEAIGWLDKNIPWWREGAQEGVNEELLKNV